VRITPIAALVAGVAILSGCGDSPDKPARQTIDTGRATGKRAKATAEGIATTPLAVAVRTSAAPKQRVTVTWGLSCPKTARGKAKGAGGTYVATPPNVRPLELPRRAIAFCAVHAEAQLKGSGRVKVTLVASPSA
jgi:hypothetical protein